MKAAKDLLGARERRRAASRRIVLPALLGLTFLLAACSSAVAPTPTSTSAPPPAPSAAVASVLPSPALALPAASSQPEESLLISYSSPSLTSLPLWIAIDGGLFRDHGLTVETQLTASNTYMAALLSGQTQMSIGGGSEVLSASAGGADLVVVAVLVPVYPYVLEANQSIQTGDQLRGGQVAISTPGSAYDIGTRVALRSLGLEPGRDVTLLSTGSTANVPAALVNGSAQAGISLPPESVRLEEQGFHPLVDLASLKAPTSQGVLVATRSYVSSHRTVVQRVIDSLVQAIARERKDRPFSIQVLQRYLKSEDTRALGIGYDYFVGEVVPTLPYPSPAQFTDAVNVLAETNEHVRDYPVQSLLDASFVQNAHDRGLEGS